MMGETDLILFSSKHENAVIPGIDVIRFCVCLFAGFEFSNIFLLLRLSRQEKETTTKNSPPMLSLRNISFYLLFFMVVGRLASEDVVIEPVVTDNCQRQENLLGSCTKDNDVYRTKVASLESALAESQALGTMHTDLMRSCASDRELLRKQLVSLELQLQQTTEALADSQAQAQAQTQRDEHEEDASLMELLMKSAKGKLLSSVPPTDKECTFDWIIGKCTPMCRCQFRPQMGDYSPSRACRLITHQHSGEEEGRAGIENQCEDETKERPWAAKLAEKVQFHAEKIAKEAHHHIRQGAQKAMTKLREVAPPTDEDCVFSLESLRCQPADLCVWDFQLGDFSPDRACRHKLTVDGEEDFVL